MKNKRASVAKVVALAVVPVSLTVVLRCRAQQVQEEKVPAPLQPVLELVPSAQGLRVKLSVRNTSNRYEMFQRMNCSWEDNWRCDKPGIQLPMRSCLRNFSETIILPPGSAHHEEQWWLLFSPKYKPGRATFRLGLVRQRSDFTSEELERIYQTNEQNLLLQPQYRHRYNRQEEVLWTNQVVANVRPEWLPQFHARTAPGRLQAQQITRQQSPQSRTGTERLFFLVRRDWHSQEPPVRRARSFAVSQLVSQGVDVNAREPLWGQTALSVAASQGDVEMARTLLSLGADVNARNRFTAMNRIRDTALRKGIVQYNVDVVRLLVERGAKVNVQVDENMPGETPLKLARRLQTSTLSSGEYYGIRLKEIIDILKAAGAKE